MNAGAAVVQLLKADGLVQELPGVEIYGDLPRGRISDRLGPTIVVAANGGGSLGPGARSYIPWQVTRLDIYCYSRTAYEAADLNQRVYAALTQMQRTRYGDTLLRDAIVSGGPIQSRDADADWTCVLSVYDVSATAAA